MGFISPCEAKELMSNLSVKAWTVLESNGLSDGAQISADGSGCHVFVSSCSLTGLDLAGYLVTGSFIHIYPLLY